MFNDYEACLGQVINKVKSVFLFSKIMNLEDLEELMHQLNIATEIFYER
jgi:hypothetical protein